MKKIEFSQWHGKTTVPLIDEVRFHLVVTTDIQRSHTEFKLNYEDSCVRLGGESHMADGAMDCYLFICRKYVMHDMIGHELHHSLHQICDRIGQPSHNDNDEMTARIAGFLNGWVYLQLDKMEIVVTHKPKKDVKDKIMRPLGWPTLPD